LSLESATCYSADVFLSDGERRKGSKLRRLRRRRRRRIRRRRRRRRRTRRKCRIGESVSSSEDVATFI